MTVKYTVEKIDDTSWRIQEENVRSFLFLGKDRALLVDTGCNIDNMRGIVEEITSKPIVVVNTHSDADHTACNEQFEKVFMHPSEYAFFYNYQPHKGVVRPIWEGDVIDLGERNFEVIATPGHTTGSISLLDRKNRLLVGGDGVQDWRIFMFGPYRDLLAYQYSMEKLDRLSAAFDIVYPAHGSFPVKSEIIKGLIKGAKGILSGELEGKPSYYGEIPIMEYDMGVAVMLMPRDKKI